MSSPGQSTEGGSRPLLQEIFPTPGTEPRAPALQADSLPAEPPGKPIQVPSYLSPIIVGLGASFISQFFHFASLPLDRMLLPSVFNF